MTPSDASGTGGTDDTASADGTGDPAHLAGDAGGATAAMVGRFRRRARNLRVSAVLALLLVLVALGGGMYLFVFAGEIASREANLTLDRLSRGVQEISEAVTEIRPELRPVLGEYQAIGEAVQRTLGETERTLAELRGAVAATDGPMFAVSGPLDPETETALRDTLLVLREAVPQMAEETLNVLEASSEVGLRLSAIMVNFELLSAETASFMQTLNQDMRQQIADTFGAVVETAARQTDEVQTTLLVSTLSTRIGAMLLIIFLVQILVNLYRYSIRLASFYDARADAFEIAAAGGGLNVPELIRSLSPDNLDFGKSPQSPAEHAIALAREVIARQPR